MIGCRVLPFRLGLDLFLRTPPLGVAKERKPDPLMHEWRFEEYAAAQLGGIVRRVGTQEGEAAEAPKLGDCERARPTEVHMTEIRSGPRPSRSAIVWPVVSWLVSLESSSARQGRGGGREE